MELGDFNLEYFVDEDLSIDCFSVLDNYFNLIINQFLERFFFDVKVDILNIRQVDYFNYKNRKWVLVVSSYK